MEDDLKEAKKASGDWGTKALAASQKADMLRAGGQTAEADRFDELAKTALRRQLSAEEQVKTYTGQVEQQTILADKLKDGLNKMRERKYGLVISDWNMEPMTGYDLLQQVRSDPSLAETPFIMVTAESKTENVIAAKKAGVSNYIVKPFNAQTLKTKIDAVFPSASAPAA